MSTQIQRFLGDPAQTQLDAEYGPFSSLDGAIVLGLFALLFGVVQLARVVVVVSPRQRRVLILEHHVLGRRRYGALPLDLVAACTLDSYQRGRHSHPYVSLVSARGEQYQLTRSGPLQQWLRESFARRVTEALNAAKL